MSIISQFCWVGGGGQMTSEFIHEEISIMDYKGLSYHELTQRGSQLAWMTSMDDWHG